MIQSKHNRGFTLIELLVVIAIIGILSAVVLASLNSARTKGADAAIKSNMQTIRTQSSIYYDTTGSQSYGTAGATCTATGSLFLDPTITSAINGVIGQGSTPVCGNSTTAWAAEAPLKSATGTYWCSDSAGSSKQVTTALTAGATVCPAS